MFEGDDDPSAYPRAQTTDQVPAASLEQATVQSRALIRSAVDASRSNAGPSRQPEGSDEKSNGAESRHPQRLEDVPGFLDLANAPRILTAFVVSYDASAAGEFWPLYQGHSMLGRLGAAAETRIALPHATVSSQHAELIAFAKPGRVFVRDCQSTNGTFLNEVPLSPNQPIELQDGDQLRLGLFKIAIKIVA